MVFLTLGTGERSDIRVADAVISPKAAAIRTELVRNHVFHSSAPSVFQGRDIVQHFDTNHTNSLRERHSKGPPIHTLTSVARGRYCT